MQGVRYWLEMRDPKWLKPALSSDPSLKVVPAIRCEPWLCRQLYAEIGRDYHWVDRLGWTDDDVRKRLLGGRVRLSILFHGGDPAGYYELAAHPDTSVELTSFGLRPAYIGRGFGKHLLSVAVEEAWRRGAARVFLHTSSFDHPAALPNYQSRGFRVYREEACAAGEE